MDEPAPVEKQKQTQILSKPPSANEKLSKDDQSAIESAIRLFTKHAEGRLEYSWTSIPLKMTQYKSFLGQLEEAHPELWAFAMDKTRYAASVTNLTEAIIANIQCTTKILYLSFYQFDMQIQHIMHTLLWLLEARLPNNFKP